MRTPTRTKTTTSTSRVLALLLAAVITAAPSWAKKKPKQPEAYATVAGTVFRTPGFALADAEITVTPDDPQQGGAKLKKEQTVTNFRGEFAVRVPPVPMKYTVHVQRNGYEPQQKTVSIEGEQRQELNFVLEPKSRPGEEKN